MSISERIFLGTRISPWPSSHCCPTIAFPHTSTACITYKFGSILIRLNYVPSKVVSHFKIHADDPKNLVVLMGYYNIIEIHFSNTFKIVHTLSGSNLMTQKLCFSYARCIYCHYFSIFCPWSLIRLTRTLVNIERATITKLCIRKWNFGIRWLRVVMLSFNVLLNNLYWTELRQKKRIIKLKVESLDILILRSSKPHSPLHMNYLNFQNCLCSFNNQEGVRRTISNTFHSHKNWYFSYTATQRHSHMRVTSPPPMTPFSPHNATVGSI